MKRIGSKLCHVLRHRPDLMGAQLDSCGRAPLRCLVEYRTKWFLESASLSLAEPDLRHAMPADNKNRYKLWFRREDVLGETPYAVPDGCFSYSGAS